jgi:flagellar biosynthesis anti-sigma factor FlgM
MAISSILSRASLPAEQVQAKQSPTAAAHASRAPTAEAVRVKVSPEAQSLARESRAVDQSKVDALRQRFAEGSFKVRPQELAQAMIAKG